MLKKTLVFALSAALLAFSLAGCAGNSSDSAKASDADSQEKTEQAADATEGASAAPITADKVGPRAPPRRRPKTRAVYSAARFSRAF